MNEWDPGTEKGCSVKTKSECRPEFIKEKKKRELC